MTPFEPTFKERPARPKISRCMGVRYKDLTNRVQCGQILSIEARWFPFQNFGDEPNIFYTVSHPTYRSKLHTITDDDIIEIVTSIIPRTKGDDE